MRSRPATTRASSARYARTVARPLPAEARRRPTKDQSYFLFSLTQEQLARAVFPVGDRAKDVGARVRAAARLAGRRQAGQPGDLLRSRRRLRGVRRRRMRRGSATAERSSTSRAARSAATPASIASRSASARASGLPSSPTGAPLYVLALRPAERQVVVGPKASLERTTLTASGVNWICAEPDERAARDGADPPSASTRRRRWSKRSDAGRARADLRRAADRRHAGTGGRLLRRRRGGRRRVDRLASIDLLRGIQRRSADVRGCCRDSARRRSPPCSLIPRR